MLALHATQPYILYQIIHSSQYQSPLNIFARTIRNLFLRGRVKDWRVLSSARNLERDYLKRIITISNPGDSKPGPIRRNTSNTTTPKPALNRILFIGDCLWEQDQLFPEIRKICHLDVVNLRDFIKTTESQSDAAVKAIAHQACDKGKQDPDLIIFYARPALLSEAAFDAIRKRWTCPVIGMNLDDRVEFFDYRIFSRVNDNYSRWVHHFDLNLTSSIAAVDWYQNMGAEVKYMPQGFRSEKKFIQPPNSTQFKYLISFVGSMKAERLTLIEQIQTFGIEPVLFGRGWKQSTWIDDPATVFRSSQINLGIGYTLASSGIANAKGRDIECPAVGACYLTTYHWELAEMFEIGKEILCYRNAEELVEMYSFFRNRPDACLKIAQAAHKRAHAEHTWEMRLRKIFAEIGFKSTLL